MITTLLWDIDGTILDFIKSENYAIRRCFEIFGLGNCDDEMIKRYSKINDTYWERLQKGEISKIEVLEGRFKEFFAKENIKCDKISEFNLEYQLRLSDNIYFTPNALKVLKDFKGKFKQYAVTNGTLRAQERKLKNSGLNEIFDDVFISDVIGYEKPSVEFFNAVEDKIGKFIPSEVMIIGDSISSDIQGGNNANILTCWYNPLNKTNKDNVKVDYHIKDFNELYEILK